MLKYTVGIIFGFILAVYAEPRLEGTKLVFNKCYTDGSYNYRFPMQVAFLVLDGKPQSGKDFAEVANEIHISSYEVLIDRIRGKFKECEK